MVNLIVCCDGTWNTPDQKDGGVPSPSNVVKIHAAVAEADASGTPQQVYYRPGVGTSGNWWQRLKGGGLGEGLGDDIKSAYFWLCTVYTPLADGQEADDIYLFGFSRGAYAVRSLAGMIGRCGLLDLRDPEMSANEQWARVDAAYAHYRKTEPGTVWDTDYPRDQDTLIAFLGVWDTVGALGIPDEFFWDIFEARSKYQFHDTMLGANVLTARHAVAIDEKRQSFSPTLWSNEPVCPDMKQVWFTGVHGDVGGLFARGGLGDITLEWMMREAAAKWEDKDGKLAAGKQALAFREDAFAQLRPNYQDVLHDSVAGVFKKFRTRPRPVPNLREDDAVHETAKNRRLNPPLRQPRYWRTRRMVPGTTRVTRVYARDRWNATGFYLEKGQTYRLTADGEWLDSDIKCTPAGPRGGFQWRKLLWGFSAPTTWAQRLARNKGNHVAATYGARREDQMPWMSLVGVIANATGVDSDTRKLCAHQTFLIGEGCDVTPTESGYLHCFANDAWRYYGNNKGSVRLTITPSG